MPAGVPGAGHPIIPALGQRDADVPTTCGVVNVQARPLAFGAPPPEEASNFSRGEQPPAQLSPADVSAARAMRRLDGMLETMLSPSKAVMVWNDQEPPQVDIYSMIAPVVIHTPASANLDALWSEANAPATAKPTTANLEEMWSQANDSRATAVDPAAGRPLHRLQNVLGHLELSFQPATQPTVDTPAIGHSELDKPIFDALGALRALKAIEQQQDELRASLTWAGPNANIAVRSVMIHAGRKERVPEYAMGRPGEVAGTEVPGFVDLAYLHYRDIFNTRLHPDTRHQNAASVLYNLNGPEEQLRHTKDESLALLMANETFARWVTRRDHPAFPEDLKPHLAQLRQTVGRLDSLQAQRRELLQGPAARAWAQIEQSVDKLVEGGRLGPVYRDALRACSELTDHPAGESPSGLLERYLKVETLARSLRGKGPKDYSPEDLQMTQELFASATADEMRQLVDSLREKIVELAKTSFIEQHVGSLRHHLID
jgi:hypothetical protein